MAVSSVSPAEEISPPTSLSFRAEIWGGGRFCGERASACFRQASLQEAQPPHLWVRTQIVSSFHISSLNAPAGTERESGMGRLGSITSWYASKGCHSKDCRPSVQDGRALRQEGWKWRQPWYMSQVQEARPGHSSYPEHVCPHSHVENQSTATIKIAYKSYPKQAQIISYQFPFLSFYGIAHIITTSFFFFYNTHLSKCLVSTFFFLEVLWGRSWNYNGNSIEKGTEPWEFK